MRLGHRWSDRVRLSAAGLEFHLSNWLDFTPRAKASRYQIRLSGIREIYLRRRSGDFFVFHEVFTSRCYALPDVVVPESPQIVVDLGANIGLTTLFLSDRFPRASYVCVEPNPENLALLRRNLSFLDHRLEVLNAAVSDRLGEARFSDSEWSWGGHLVADGRATRSVQCITLDEIISRCRLGSIDVLKVDVEGAEREIFSGAPAWLKKVRCVVIELHNDYSFADFQRDIMAEGFDAFQPGSPVGNPMILALPAAKLRDSWN
jgi:FkbM family methyltransferase